MDGGFFGTRSWTTMCKLRLFISAILVVAGFVSTAAADLTDDIKRTLSDKLLARARVGIEIVKLSDQADSCRIVFQQNQHMLLMPASNMKLLTTAAALHTLSPQFRFRTKLVKHGNDLVVWGDGDPTFGDSELMDKIGWSQMAVFDGWADELAKRNITAVSNVVVDDSLFDTQFIHPHWGKNQYTTSGVELGGLNFSANLLTFEVRERRGGPAAWTTRPATSYVRVLSNTCTGGDNNIILARVPSTNDVQLKGTVEKASDVSIAITDPPMYVGTVFADLLKSRGIQVSGSAIRDRSTRQQYNSADPATRDQQWQALCVLETPLSRVVNQCNKVSMNLYAEAMCKRMGAAASGQGTWQTGTAVTGSFLKQLGVPEDEFHLDDGCGLSRENRVTADAIVRVLMHSYYSPAKDIYLSSLPIGGVDGTLRKRFTGSLRARVFAKTGFIANVSALSGYLRTRGGDWYAFSILMNGIPDHSNSSITPLQEDIVEALDKAASGG